MKSIALTKVQLDGFVTENILPGEDGSMLVRATLTSDQPDFYLYMRGIQGVINDRIRAAGIHFNLDHTSSLLLLVHSDKSADLYLGPLSLRMEITAKRDLKAGDVLYLTDVADLRKVGLPDVSIRSDDQVIYCFKVGWKFGLFFDLIRGRDFNIVQMELELANLRRHLLFQNEYEAVSDPIIFALLTEAGWFPFIEIMGGEFERLLNAFKSECGIEEQEAALLSSFDENRIDRIGNRWWKRPHFEERRPILEPALKAFKNGDNVSCLKNLLTEIEGIIRDKRIADLGSSVKLDKLLDFVIEQGIKKTGTEASLFFPKEFLRYLRNHTFADFNPHKAKTDRASRHSVGHGGATSDAYTDIRALQAILTLDQICFFL